MKLYEMSAHMREITELVEKGEVTQEMVADTMEGLSGQFEDKARATLKVRQGMLGDIGSIDMEIDRLNKMKKSLEGSCEWLTEYLKNNMLLTGQDKIDLGIFRITLRQPTVCLESVDESKVSDNFFATIPASKKLDKRRLLTEAKQGDIDGVVLGMSKRSLVIK